MQKRAARIILAGFVASLVGLTFGIQPSSGTAAQTVTNLTLTLVTPGRIITGHRVTFSGTAPRVLNGRVVSLQRRVGSGAWVRVAGAKVAQRTFRVSGTAISVGTNKWRAIASLNGVSHLSPVKATPVWKWYGLAEANAAVYDSFYFDQAPVNMGSHSYSSAILLSAGGHMTFARTAAWNLSYKCAEFVTDYGLTNDSDSGATAQFGYDLDGASTSLGTRGIGQPGHLDVSVLSHFRVTLSFQALSPNGTYTYQAYAGARLLCRGYPF